MYKNKFPRKSTHKAKSKKDSYLVTELQKKFVQTIKKNQDLADNNNKQSKPLVEHIIKLGKKDLKEVQGLQNYFNEFLKLQQDDMLTQSLKDALDAWIALDIAKKEKDLADVILIGFYKNGKVNDYFIELESIIDNIENKKDATKAREIVYYNYIYQIQIFVNEIKNKYIKKQDQFDISIKKDEQFLLWYIDQNCNEIDCLKDLLKAMNTIDNLLLQIENKVEKTQDYKDKLLFVSHTKDALEKAINESNFHDIDMLMNIAEKYQQRIHFLQEDIDEAQKVYDVLINVMSDAWFDCFNPEIAENMINQMTLTQLKTYYKNQLKDIMYIINKK